MKIKITALFVAFFLSSGFVFAATNDITALLQKGLFEEEANHNLEAAMRHYQAAVAGFDQDRQLAATAIFRMGECDRKLGHTNEASIQYQRVLREFSDQTNLAKLCTEYLGGVGSVAVIAVVPEEKHALIQETLDNLKIKLISVDAELAAVSNMNEDLLEGYFSNVKPDSVLTAYKNAAVQAQTKVAQVQNLGFGPNHPEYKTALQELSDITNNIANRAHLLVNGLQAESHSLHNQVNALQSEMVQSSGTIPTAAGVPNQQNQQLETALTALRIKAVSIDTERTNRDLERYFFIEQPDPILVGIMNAIDQGNLVMTEGPKSESALDLAAYDKTMKGRDHLFHERDSRLGVLEQRLDLESKALHDQIDSLQSLMAQSSGTSDFSGRVRSAVESAGSTLSASEASAITTATGTSAEDEEVRKIKEMIRNSPDLINSQYNGYGFPLQSAVAEGNMAAAELLLANGAEVNGAAPNTTSPLGAAAQKGNKAMIELLLAKGADLHAVDKHTGRTPLELAVNNGFKVAAEVLLAHGAEVNATGRDGSTPLMAATGNGYTALAELLLTKGAGANVRDQTGLTPLDRAVLGNHADTVRLLLGHKAEINLTPTNGIPPLLLAASRKDIDFNLVKSLVEAGADAQAPSPVDFDRHDTGFGGDRYAFRVGAHPLDLAVESDRLDLVELFLTNHADPNAIHATYANGSAQQSGPPVLWAVWYNHPQKKEILQALLAHGANPDLPDEKGVTALAWAAMNNQTEMVQILLEHHADPNKPDHVGMTPVGRIGTGYPEIRKLLLDAGANEDFQRLTSIFVAQKGTGSLGQRVFYHGTNNVNQFTLLETIAESCQDGRPPVEFPDFGHVAINRLKPGGAKEDIAVNLNTFFVRGDCGLDVPLQWGDVVQIPQMDHLLNQPAPSLRGSEMEFLTKCLERRVEIIVKGQTNRVTILPRFAGTRAAPPVDEKIVRGSFFLSDVVQRANVLLLSSDLSRVKVTRHGAEFLWNIEPPASTPSRFAPVLPQKTTIPASADLWLLNGDSIEIPERLPAGAPR